MDKTEWQPIETAPRDGTSVLLYAEMWEMSWGIQIGHFEGDGEGSGEWVTSEGAVADNEPGFDPNAEEAEEAGEAGEDTRGEDSGDQENMGPTYWMPLPDHPVSP